MCTLREFDGVESETKDNRDEKEPRKGKKISRKDKMH